MLRTLLGLEIQACAVEIFKDPDEVNRLAFNARILLFVLLHQAPFALPPQASRTTVLIWINPCRHWLRLWVRLFRVFSINRSHVCILGRSFGPSMNL
ncbi:MAG: hypothetical protein EB088_12130 [Betaproteobacteria bacterium]|nr:hypothetical protein [Betaproteobacteria bacterium]